jgi:hypothetical protein
LYFHFSIITLFALKLASRARRDGGVGRGAGHLVRAVVAVVLPVAAPADRDAFGVDVTWITKND